jgi:hypothetical protein
MVIPSSATVRNPIGSTAFIILDMFKADKLVFFPIVTQ